jgi:hypothetical protein
MGIQEATVLFSPGWPSPRQALEKLLANWKATLLVDERNGRK